MFNIFSRCYSELEFRIARDLAKSMNVGPQPSSNRNFGSSVPVHGEKNDAPVFRNDLKPAIPVMERQASISKLHHQVTSKSNLPLYQTVINLNMILFTLFLT